MLPATAYRLIDTASSYQNEKAVGRAIGSCGVPREELFITTKAYIQQMGYEKTKEAFAQSLDNLGLTYLDLYLIHMPFGDYYGSWRALEELYQEGKIRAIGVCNFLPDRLLHIPAQVILRWNVQQRVVVIPKSIHRDRMEENLAIWDFVLDPEEMEQIAALDQGCPSMLDTRKTSEVKRVYDYLNHPVLTSL